MKSSKLLTALGLASTLTISSIVGLSKPKEALAQSTSGLPIALSLTHQKASVPIAPTESELIAFNIPNFQPSVSFSNGVLQLGIPTAYFRGFMDQILAANGGRMKDTDFNRVDIRNMRVASFRDGGFAVYGEWQVQHRELLGSVFGKKHYSPWVSVSGSFTQNFDVSIRDRKLNVKAGKNDIKGASKWYGAIVDSLVPLLGVNGKVTNGINAQLKSINGMDVVQLLSQFGSDKVASALGIDRNAVNQLLNQSTVDAKFTGDQLVISAKVR